VLTANSHVVLRDGRRLSYFAAGPAHGAPVVYMHGAIGSPVRCSDSLAATIRAFGIRYLMPERPGFGGSDSAPGRSVASFAADIEGFADALGLGRFSVVGVSAGAPYALACAVRLAGRVAAAAAVSSMPPGLQPRRARGMGMRYRAGLGLLHAHPGACARTGDRALDFLRRHPGVLGRVIVSGAPASDKRLLADREARDTAVRSFFAAAHRGVRPMVEDFAVCCADWGFALGEVESPVHLWHGERDRLVPLAAVQRMAAAIPAARLEVSADDGHFFFRSRLPEIFAPLVSPLQPGSATRLDLAA
jgi:pimeloyl-ACP methyl ester carboxylesterase